jgi:putative CocE/NonD family hydrolase
MTMRATLETFLEATMTRRAAAIFVALTSLCAVPLAGQAPADSAFVNRNEMVPMRDGVKVYTRIFIPKGATDKLPFMFVRTPYGVDGWSSARVSQAHGELAADGYIFVFQDIRGRYRSEGQFVMQRPPRRDRNDPKAIDESTDAYDSIDWLLKNVPNNNGRVGMFGVSYPGWLTGMAMLDPHPALKAASPQASPSDMFLGDDFHHNGAFRLSYGFEYAAMMESSKENENFAFDRYDTYEWYLNLGPLSAVNERVLKGKIPTWNDFVAHPNYDAFWQRQAMAPYLTKVTVPTLNVAGWWDQEDFYGPIKIYETLEKHDANNLNFLVVGPWNHGGWNAAEGRKLGNIDFGSATSKYFREKIQAPFFAFYLKDKGSLKQPEAITFEAGSNEWKTYDSWPPKHGVTARNLYFQPNGKLSFQAPATEDSTAYDGYVSDPAHPVPYRKRPIEATYDPRGSGWYTWLLEDQRVAQNRPDVLSWSTELLTEDVEIAGDIVTKLFASTTGSDADWIVKLIDVYPERIDSNPKMGGYELMVANEVLRGRFRNNFEKPEAIVPNKVTDFSVGLHTQSYKFLKGHRIMVQVQSTWFPIIDRNPQTFVPNIFQAKATDFRAATQRVFRSKKFASHISLPVVEPIRQ